MSTKILAALLAMPLLPAAAGLGCEPDADDTVKSDGFEEGVGYVDEDNPQMENPVQIEGYWESGQDGGGGGER